MLSGRDMLPHDTSRSPNVQMALMGPWLIQRERARTAGSEGMLPSTHASTTQGGD